MGIFLDIYIFLFLRLAISDNRINLSQCIMQRKKYSCNFSLLRVILQYVMRGQESFRGLPVNDVAGVVGQLADPWAWLHRHEYSGGVGWAV